MKKKIQIFLLSTLIHTLIIQRTGHYMDSIASAISPALEDEEVIMDQLKE